MEPIPVIGLDELTALVSQGADDLFVRWSKGPQVDMPGGTSRDDLTGVLMPGLSASPLRVERWWGRRPLRLWVARRLYDYRHLAHLRPGGTRPWVMRGTVVGRGPDNEPLVACDQAIAWIGPEAMKEAERLVEEQNAEEWGPLSRSGDRPKR
jgi:hypothetical protein